MSFSFSEDSGVDARVLVAVGALAVSQALRSEVDASSKEPRGWGLIFQTQLLRHIGAQDLA